MYVHRLTNSLNVPSARCAGNQPSPKQHAAADSSWAGLKLQPAASKEQYRYMQTTGTCTVRQKQRCLQGTHQSRASLRRGGRPCTWPVPQACCPIDGPCCHTHRHTRFQRHACKCVERTRKHGLGAGVPCRPAVGVTTPSGRRPGARGAAALDHRPKATAQVKPQPTQSLRAGPIPERHMTCTAQHTTCKTSQGLPDALLCRGRLPVRWVQGHTPGHPAVAWCRLALRHASRAAARPPTQMRVKTTNTKGPSGCRGCNHLDLLEQTQQH